MCVDPHMYGSLLLKPIHKGSPLERSSSTPPKPSGGLTPLSSSFRQKARGGFTPLSSRDSKVLGTKYLVPGTWYQVPGTRYLVPSTWYQVPGTKYLVPSTLTKCLVPCTWYMIQHGSTSDISSISCEGGGRSKDNQLRGGCKILL